MTAWKANVPAPRYELFISAFEKKVAAYQEIIRAAEKAEQTYNICREALEVAKLPNDVRLDFSASKVSIEIDAVPTDRIATFDRVLSLVGDRLVAAKLRADPEPAVGDLGWRSGRFAIFQVVCPRTGARGKVEVNIRMPEEGIVDLTCEPYESTFTSTLYKMTPRGSGAGVLGRVHVEPPEIQF